jgi:hypothetical protein
MAKKKPKKRPKKKSAGRSYWQMIEKLCVVAEITGAKYSWY